MQSLEDEPGAGAEGEAADVYAVAQEARGCFGSDLAIAVLEECVEVKVAVSPESAGFGDGAPT